jgi:branched-chain amino acid aminotransferase
MPIPTVDTIWMNGKLVPWDEAKVHVLTHALHYGSGVFEGMRAYKTDRGAAVFRLNEHLERLRRSAKLYYMDLPYTVTELAQATKDVIKANKLDSCYIRPLLYRGYGEMGLYPMHAPIEAVIAVWPWGAYLGDDGVKHGIRAKVSSFQALGHTQLARAAKATGQYLNSILAKVEVTNAGYDEAIMLDAAGHVCEGSGENLFVVRDGVLYTPFPTDGVLYTPVPTDGVLEGLTRDTVLRIAADEGIEARERTMARSDLVIADELFFTGTAAEIVPIREVDDHAIGEPGPVTRRIQQRYRDIVEGRDETFAHFLDHVDG